MYDDKKVLATWPQAFSMHAISWSQTVSCACNCHAWGACDNALLAPQICLQKLSRTPAFVSAHDLLYSWPGHALHCTAFMIYI